MKIIIPLAPVTKKNSQQIFRGKNGRPFITQSERYKQYEIATGYYLKPLGIANKVNVQAIYYMPSRRKVDLINLHSALHDCMVKHGTVVDDNSNIIVSTDGSRVDYDKDKPRTEVEIKEVQG